MEEMYQVHDLLAIILERDLGLVPTAQGEAKVSLTGTEDNLQATITVTWPVVREAS